MTIFTKCVWKNDALYDSKVDNGQVFDGQVTL
jgi:hypothetical protein